MKKNDHILYSASLSQEPFPRDLALKVLDPKGFRITELLDQAYQIRQEFFGNEVTVHILNNVENGACPEDCQYCAQSSKSDSPIEAYRMKPVSEIMKEAEAAYKNGAFRYCMVFSGTGPSDERVDKLCTIIQDIKAKFSLEVCVSPGVVTPEQTVRLKKAGLDRLNHNLNTSERHYQNICSTHTYEDRVATLQNAKLNGLSVCSGVIVGMGEADEDIVAMAQALRSLKVESLPVNFFIPLEGVPLKKGHVLFPAKKEHVPLNPELCLRVLCLFRFLNPRTEIRVAAGRELHLKSAQPLALYPANSLFLSGYLNAVGGPDRETLQMIQDMGMTIKSEVPLEELLAKTAGEAVIKGRDELRRCR